MDKSNADLEQSARELCLRAEVDNNALSELCEVYWKLDQQDASVAAFVELLQRTGQIANKQFDEIYLNALLSTRSCPTPLRRRSRLQRLVKLLGSTAKIDGLIVECGCYRGLSSYMLCSYLRHEDPSFDGRGYHVFDSFAGLSEPTEDDEIPSDWSNARELRQMTQPGRFAASLAVVRRGLKEFTGITYHPGWIPLTFTAMVEARYRFVHIDVDLYDPTLDALTYFFPRLSQGGLIVSDDYSWPGARRAINQYCGEHEIALQLSTDGQAIVRKD